eukprot:gnl/TRDRNA2_/TRDRNA2_173236_c0_seq2.p1 gnl/TRDRNA2_/TRDRNA2_173236_c0~~gnl/TRDRNA2_/TRDRNA2_173236_c0_seq2.p1  ORF type:complete len:302 (-),score=26.59 gnl/TRDRNA2_/TRDRNA2_173236_c0_seq2:223-1128(-)
MPSKLFVGSLPDNIPEQMLREYFSKFGHVEEVFVKPFCPIGQQFAFVTMSDYDEALDAKNQCDRRVVFEGCRPIEVMFARTQSHPHSKVTKLHVTNIPPGADESMLKVAFGNFGYVQEVQLFRVQKWGSNWAVVTYHYPEDASRARQLAHNQLRLPGSSDVCIVTFYRNDTNVVGTKLPWTQYLQRVSERAVDPGEPSGAITKSWEELQAEIKLARPGASKRARLANNGTSAHLDPRSVPSSGRQHVRLPLADAERQSCCAENLVLGLFALTFLVCVSIIVKKLRRPGLPVQDVQDPMLQT